MTMRVELNKQNNLMSIKTIQRSQQKGEKWIIVN